MKVLLVEDDNRLSETVEDQLQFEGYEVEACDCGEDATYYMDQNEYDIIILDRMLPGVDGLTLLRQQREKGNHTPIIIITAMNSLNDRVDGLDYGADDYLVKPFAMKELLARIRALLRRPKSIEDTETLEYKDIQYNVKQKLLQNRSREKGIRLSRREGALLEYLIMNANRLMTREQILARVWANNEFVEDGNIDNYIYILRRRLKAVDSKVSIKTVYGVGYQLESA